MKPKLLLSLPKGVGENYISAFYSAGFEICADYLAQNLLCDGLVLCGGGDIDPVYYGKVSCGSNPPDKERDKSEFFLFEHYYALKKPVFGICRGMQVVNVALGGSLVQDIKNGAHISKKGDVFHMVKNIKETPTEQLFGGRMQVNSAHHQSCSSLGEGLFVTQKAYDGIIEGIYGKNIIATQWHPERMVLSHRKKEFCDVSLLFKFFRKMF